MLYVGIADVQVPDYAVDLDGGVILSPARSRLMRPFLLTSGWGEPETSFGGSRIHSDNPGYDIVGQVAVPTALLSDGGLHVDGTAWLFASLLRLASTPRLRTPVVSTGPFDEHVLSTGTQTVPLEREIIPDRLQLAPDAPASLSPEGLDWVRTHWSKCLNMVRHDSAFGLLLRAIDGATFVGDASLALVMMWGALENIFSPARVELKFRVSGNISCFLEPPGANRVAVQRASAKLYDARSAAAHGKPHNDLAPAAQTYALARRVVMKILETGKVPNASNLEEMLLAGR
ncbi:MAG: hypothetical protein WBP25_16755 [Giesbergeria sp.]